jgi:hypothetical protein
VTARQKLRLRIASETKALLQQRLLRESGDADTESDALYVRLARECDRWAGEKKP